NYLYGSLGNLREKSVGSLVPPIPSTTLFVDTSYEAAGRIWQTCSQFAASQINSCSAANTYVSNSYDSGCMSPGTQPGCGKLYQSIGSNYPLDPGPAVTQVFTYFTADGRLSTKTTTIGSDSDSNDGAGVRDGESVAVSESWTYSNLGLVATHNLPR